MSVGLGDRVRKLREDHNLSLRQLAEKIGTSKAYLWQIENREHPNPSASIVLEISRVFSVSPYHLIDGRSSEAQLQIEDVVLFNKISSLPNPDRQVLSEMVDALYRRAG